MEFHGIDTKGEIYIQRLVTLPGAVPDVDDEGRILYTEDNDTLYFAARSGGSPIWQPISFEPGTIALFGQNSAPIGWTRKTDWADNAMLCYAANGNIANGGIANPEAAHVHNNNGGHNHTFTLAEVNIPTHSHTVNPPATNTTTVGTHGHPATVSGENVTTSLTGNHSHTVNPPAANTTIVGTHNHPSTVLGGGATKSEVTTSIESDHRHTVEPPYTLTSLDGSHTHNLLTRHNINYGAYHDDTLYGSAEVTTKYQPTSPNGNHNHSVEIAKFNSGSDGRHSHTITIETSAISMGVGHSGSHNHSVDIPSFNSGNVSDHSHTVTIGAKTVNMSNNGSHNHSVNIPLFNSGNIGNGNIVTTNTQASANTLANIIPKYQEVIAAEKN